MKTTILKLALVLLFIPLISSCSKDDDGDSGPTYSEENFMDNYLTSTGFDEESVEFVNSGSYEFGLEFTPLVKGQITSLAVKLPDVNNSLRITIWDVAAGTIVKTEIVNVSAAGNLFTFDVVDIELVKDKKYCISMNSNDWYERSNTAGTDTSYPTVAGNISIDAYKWAGGLNHEYPTLEATDYYAGDLSFNFLRTE